MGTRRKGWICGTTPFYAASIPLLVGSGPANKIDAHAQWFANKKTNTDGSVRVNSLESEGCRKTPLRTILKYTAAHLLPDIAVVSPGIAQRVHHRDDNRLWVVQQNRNDDQQ